MFCRHKLGKVEDGYQYCKKCGKAFIVECPHTFVDSDSFNVLDECKRIVRYKKIVKCSKCGIYKSYVFTVDTEN